MNLVKMNKEEFYHTCNQCGEKIPSGLPMTNICVDCLIKTKQK